MDGAAEDGSIGLTEFFGVRIPPKQVVTVGSAPDLSTDVLDTIHLSQVALGGGATEGRHVVWVEADGHKSVIGSLTLGGTEQFQIDFHVNDEIKVHHSGKSDVYITGYTTRNYIGYPGPSSSDEEDSDEDEEMMSESEEEADAREAAAAQLNGPARKQKQRAAAAAARAIEAAAAAGGDEDEEDSSDEEWLSGDEEDLAAAEAGVQSHRFSDLSEEDDSDEDEDDEDDDAGLPIAGRIKQQQGMEEDSDEDDSDEDEGDEESDDDEEPTAALPASKAVKRAAAVTPLSAQQPPKKARTDAAPATPTSPRQGEPAYEADLVKFLTTNGPTKLAVLGSQVKRAPGLPKMKKFLGDRSAIFSVDDQTGVVALV